MYRESVQGVDPAAPRVPDPPAARNLRLLARICGAIGVVMWTFMLVAHGFATEYAESVNQAVYWLSGLVILSVGAYVLSFFRERR